MNSYTFPTLEGVIGEKSLPIGIMNIIFGSKFDYVMKVCTQTDAKQTLPEGYPRTIQIGDEIFLYILRRTHTGEIYFSERDLGRGGYKDQYLS